MEDIVHSVKLASESSLLGEIWDGDEFHSFAMVWIPNYHYAMSAPLIFITGATGFIGSATAVEALKAGDIVHSVKLASESSLLGEIWDGDEFHSFAMVW
jgi:hypothetical protein